MIQKEYNTYLNIGEVTADSFIVNASISPLTVTNYDVEDFNLADHPNADIECECTYALLKNKKYDCSFEENGYTYSFVGEITKCSYNDNSYSVGLHTFSGIDTYFIDDDSSEGDSSDDPDVPTTTYSWNVSPIAGELYDGIGNLSWDFKPTIDGVEVDEFGPADNDALGFAFELVSYSGSISPDSTSNAPILCNTYWAAGMNDVWLNENSSQTSATGIYNGTFGFVFHNNFDDQDQMSQLNKEFFDNWEGTTVSTTITVTDTNANNVQPNV